MVIAYDYADEVLIGLPLNVLLTGGARKVTVAKPGLVVAWLLAPAVWCTAAVCVGVGWQEEFGRHERPVFLGQAFLPLPVVAPSNTALPVLSMGWWLAPSGWDRVKLILDAALACRLVSPKSPTDPCNSS